MIKLENILSFHLVSVAQPATSRDGIIILDMARTGVQNRLEPSMAVRGCALLSGIANKPYQTVCEEVMLIGQSM